LGAAIANESGKDFGDLVVIFRRFSHNVFEGVNATYADVEFVGAEALKGFDEPVRNLTAPR
jgi:hypothetical protein